MRVILLNQTPLDRDVVQFDDSMGRDVVISMPDGPRSNLTAERDAADALTTLGALLNLGPAATWREVSAAVAEMLDKTPRSTHGGDDA